MARFGRCRMSHCISSRRDVALIGGQRSREDNLAADDQRAACSPPPAQSSGQTEPNSSTSRTRNRRAWDQSRPEGPADLRNLSVREKPAAGPRYRQNSKTTNRAGSGQVLRALPGLSRAKSQRSGTLSGGEQADARHRPRPDGPVRNSCSLMTSRISPQIAEDPRRSSGEQEFRTGHQGAARWRSICCSPPLGCRNAAICARLRPGRARNTGPDPARFVVSNSAGTRPAAVFSAPTLKCERSAGFGDVTDPTPDDFVCGSRIEFRFRLPRRLCGGGLQQPAGSSAAGCLPGSVGAAQSAPQSRRVRFDMQ